MNLGAFHLMSLLLIEWQDRTMFMSTCVTGKHPLISLQPNCSLGVCSS